MAPRSSREISGPRAKISCLGPLVSGASKSRDEQKKGHSLRRCSNFGSTSSDEQNEIIASADVQISARNQKKHHRDRRP